MPAETATALVVRGSDWSETSRIATLWSREFGKLRVLAKGGRRLNSSFEVALDLLNVCHIAVIRKSSGGLDLLTEAQVAERFPKLRTHLPALYAAYYIAELLADGTEVYDPHAALFDATLTALRELGEAGANVGPRLAAYELTWLQELGYSPALETCAACGRPVPEPTVFSASAGGIVCPECLPRQREKRSITPAALRMLQSLGSEIDAWRQTFSPPVRAEVRALLGQYVTYRLSRRMRTLPYVGG
jgi:DNA repair protein RecO (recombination protein O)